MDLNNKGNIDTDLTKTQLRSRTLVVSTPRVLCASQTTTVNTTNPYSNTLQVEQVQSSSRFSFSENEGSHKNTKGCRARISKANKKPNPF